MIFVVTSLHIGALCSKTLDGLSRFKNVWKNSIFSFLYCFWPKEWEKVVPKVKFLVWEESAFLGQSNSECWMFLKIVGILDTPVHYRQNIWQLFIEVFQKIVEKVKNTKIFSTFFQFFALILKTWLLVSYIFQNLRTCSLSAVPYSTILRVAW